MVNSEDVKILQNMLEDYKKITGGCQNVKRVEVVEANHPQLKDDLGSLDGHVVDGVVYLRKGSLKEMKHTLLHELIDEDSRGGEAGWGRQVDYINAEVMPFFTSVFYNIKEAPIECLRRNLTNPRFQKFLSKYFPAASSKRSTCKKSEAVVDTAVPFKDGLTVAEVRNADKRFKDYIPLMILTSKPLKTGQVICGESLNLIRLNAGVIVENILQPPLTSEEKMWMEKHKILKRIEGEKIEIIKKFDTSFIEGLDPVLIKVGGSVRSAFYDGSSFYDSRVEFPLPPRVVNQLTAFRKRLVEAGYDVVISPISFRGKDSPLRYFRRFPKYTSGGLLPLDLQIKRGYRLLKQIRRALWFAAPLRETRTEPKPALVAPLISIPTAKISKRRGRFILEIERDLEAVVRSIVDLMILRFSSYSKSHFKGVSERKCVEQGVVGQLCFESLLSQWRIPHLASKPFFIDEEHRVLFDYEIKDFGVIELKTVGAADRFLAVNRSRWDKEVELKGAPKYVVVLKVFNRFQAEVCGWIEGERVAQLPHDHNVCPYSECYCCSLEELHPFSELEPLLKAHSLDKVTRSEGEK
ncbi:MAG: hypothetical protein QXW32_06445 [Nitrososphaerales archaeon]